MINKDKEHFSYQKASASTKDIILSWFEKEHVRKFYYGDGLQNTLNNIELYIKGIRNNGRYSFDHWVAFYDGKPMGFLMTSPIEGPHDNNDPYNKWYIEGKSTLTLDLLIGSEEHLRKGLSVPMIKYFIEDNFSDADYFLIDPEEDNQHAANIYQKCGFVHMETFTPDYNPKPHSMMRLEVKTR